MNILLKEILCKVTCIQDEITKLQKEVEYIKRELVLTKRNMEIVSDHTIKFDNHIEFIENKFNWYKSTLDCIHGLVTFKFLGNRDDSKYKLIE
jgi:hypothetical protein